MQKNDAIQIEQVGNGFLVSTPPTFNGNCVALDDRRVFQSHAELATFLAEHFSHRNAAIKADRTTSAG